MYGDTLQSLVKRHIKQCEDILDRPYLDDETKSDTVFSLDLYKGLLGEFNCVQGRYESTRVTLLDKADEKIQKAIKADDDSEYTKWDTFKDIIKKADMSTLQELAELGVLLIILG